jgi:valyl-tRNA synthetase
VVGSIRNMRGEVKIPLGEKRAVRLSVEDSLKYKFLSENTRYFSGLAHSEPVEVINLSAGEEVKKEKFGASGFNKGIYITLFLSSEDIEKEKVRIEKQIIKIEKQLEGLNKRLNSQGFVSKAPAHVVEGERIKATEFEEQLKNLKDSLKHME